MNTKNRLIEKLLKFAKKHKVFTYPVLALIAVISFVCNLFDVKSRSGKRIVAIIMVMVLFVSQSYFMTSSADNLIDEEEDIIVQEQLQADDFSSDESYDNHDLIESEDYMEEDTDDSNNLVQSPYEISTSPDENTYSDDYTNQDVTDDNYNTNATIDGSNENSTETTMNSTDSESIDLTVNSENGQDLSENEEAVDDSTTVKKTYKVGDSESQAIPYKLYFCDSANSATLLASGLVEPNEVDGNEYNLNNVISSSEFASFVSQNEKTESGDYVIHTGVWYLDSGLTGGISDLSAVTPNAGKEIHLFCKRELAKYRIYIEHAKVNNAAPNFSTNPEISSSNIESEGVFYVDINNVGQSDQYGDLELTSVKRDGYTLDDVIATDGTLISKTDSSATVRFSGSASKKSLTLVWKPIKYSLVYILDDENNQFVQDVTFDSNELFIAGNGKVVPKTGFIFSGKWSIPSLGIEVNEGDPIISYQDDLRTGDIRLIPVNEYDEVELNKKKVEFQYKEYSRSGIIQAKYKTVSNLGTFTYEVSEQSRNLLSQYGIKIVSAGNAGFEFETLPDGAIKSTSGTSFSVEITIKDVNSPNQIIQPQLVEITVVPRKILIVAPTDLKTTKVYDGNKEVAFAKDGVCSLPTTDPDIMVEYDAAKVHYNSSNVEEASRIIFPKDNLNMVAQNGENINNYQLVMDGEGDFSIPGTITPKKLIIVPKVVFTNGRNYVRAGEEDPKFEFVLEDESDLVKGDTTEWLSKIAYTTTRPNDLLLERKGEDACTIRKVITTGIPGGSNYAPIPDTSVTESSSFEVIMEDTVEKKNYSLSGQRKSDDNEWYYGGGDSGIVIEPSDGYNTAMISLNGGKSYSVSEAIKEDISNNDSVFLYLLSDKNKGGTGAVTKPIPIKIKYDSSAPKYEGYTFIQTNEYDQIIDYTSGDSTGLYFPGIGGVLDFGTYMKSTLNLKVKYTDTVSGVKTLHYGLYNENPNQVVEFNKITGYATIKILAASVPKMGAIRCYAEDEAGNVSEMIQLSPTGNQDNLYEWGVESIAPEIESFNVYGQVYGGQTVSVGSNREWYNHCTAELIVGDADAGIHAVIWHINDETITTNYDKTKTVSDLTLSQSIDPKVYSSDNASYTVYAEIQDNAGNVIETDKISFKVDDVPPSLNVAYDKDKWISDEKVVFTVSDDLSGVDYAKVTDCNGVTIDCYLEKQNNDGVYSASFEATEKGKYTVYVMDHAGNANVWSEEIDHISNQAPKCPEISVVPNEPNGENDWYTCLPTINIKTVEKTEDGTPVNSFYQMWLEDEQPLNQDKINGGLEKRAIEEDGIYNIKAWSTSVSNVNCAQTENDQLKIKVDTQSPKIAFTTSKGTASSSIMIQFEVTDNGSGVDYESVKVLHGAQKKVAEIKETENGCSGSFEVTSTGNYYIVAKDKAGNEAEIAAFTPMSMKVKPVTNISANSATVGANVIKGTFDIASVNISYRPISEENFTEAEAVVSTDESGNVKASSVLTNLVENTTYAYKIVAVSEASTDDSTGEVLEYIGYFKTLSSTEKGISYTGTAKYFDNRDGEITVGLYEGNLCIMAMEIKAGEDFTFNNIKDGSYTVVATDGEYSKSARLVIEDGRVIYPTKYMTLILSGKNTAVVITTSETPNVTADNMDSIFADDPINFTPDDVSLIESGGMVEFKLYATLINVTDVSAAEVSAMYNATDSRKIVGAYLDLSLYKVTTFPDGKVLRERVTELARGANVSVTIPLGSLANKKGLVVVRIHDDGDRYVGAYLSDDDSNPSTYTISSNQFSTYAVLYDPTLPEEQRTTEEVIPNNSSKPSNTEVNTVPSISGTTEEIVDTIGDKKEETKKPSKKKDTKKPIKNTSASIGSLKSSGSAKTGDETPIVIVGIMMMISICGVIVLQRKKEKE